MPKFNPNQIINSPIPTDTYPEGAHTDSEEIERLFDLAPSSSFIDSIYDWWEEKGFLTEAQFNKLSEIAGVTDTRDKFDTSDGDWG